MCVIFARRQRLHFCFIKTLGGSGGSFALKDRETHGCVVSTVATDVLTLKHQAISIHNADLTLTVLDQFHIKKI